jgi:hypothetical protein
LFNTIQNQAVSIALGCWRLIAIEDGEIVIIIEDVKNQSLKKIIVHSLDSN